MTTSEKRVTVHCDEQLADILILDSQFAVVAHGCSPLQLNLRPGLYVVKARVGDDETMRPFAVSPQADEVTVRLERPDFSSPIPDDWGWRDGPLTRASYAGAGSSGPLQPDAECELELICRMPETAPSGSAFQIPPAMLLDLSSDANQDSEWIEQWRIENNTAVHACRLTAGSFALSFFDEKASKLDGVGLTLIPGMRLLCFIQFWNGPDETLQPDLGDMAIHYVALDAEFVQSSEVIATEVLRKGLREGCVHACAPHLRTLVEQQQSGPMLKLYAGHVLAAALPETAAILRMLIDSLSHQLGEKQADILAFKSALGCDVLDRVTSLPILSDSWSLLMDVLLKNPEHPAQQALEALVQDFVPNGTFVRWTVPVGADYLQAFDVGNVDLMADDVEQIAQPGASSIPVRSYRRGSHAATGGTRATSAGLTSCLQGLLDDEATRVALTSISRETLLWTLPGPAVDLLHLLRSRLTFKSGTQPLISESDVLELQRRLRVPMGTLARSVEELSKLMMAPDVGMIEYPTAPQKHKRPSPM